MRARGRGEREGSGNGPSGGSCTGRAQRRRRCAAASARRAVVPQSGAACGPSQTTPSTHNATRPSHRGFRQQTAASRNSFQTCSCLRRRGCAWVRRTSTAAARRKMPRLERSSRSFWTAELTVRRRATGVQGVRPRAVVRAVRASRVCEGGAALGEKLWPRLRWPGAEGSPGLLRTAALSASRLRLFGRAHRQGGTSGRTVPVGVRGRQSGRGTGD